MICTCIKCNKVLTSDELLARFCNGCASSFDEVIKCEKIKYYEIPKYHLRDLQRAERKN